MATRTRSTKRRSAAPTPARVVVENVIRPGTSRSVDATKYGAMRRAVLDVVPRKGPGVTLADALAAVRSRLPQALFPDGASAGWWFKTVQLDLEAKHQIVRERTSPIRLRRV